MSQKQKPAKPRKNFPLYPHSNGQWAKKIKGKTYFFGVWADPDAAEQNYLDQAGLLSRGVAKQASSGVVYTIAELVNDVLHEKKKLVDRGELRTRTWNDYKESAELILKSIGRIYPATQIGPEEFQKIRDGFPSTWGPKTVEGKVGEVRMFFNFAYKSGWLEYPPRFGRSLMKPPARRMRAHRASQPEKYWEAGEIRVIVDCSPQPMKSFVLLGINCAFNPSDCGTLPLEAIDFEGGWIDYTRPKTAFPRKAKLWPETIQSIQEWLSVRPETLEYEHLTFVTKYRNPWHRENSGVKHSAVSTSFAKICEKNKIDRKGRSFGALRHTFKTRAEDIDTVAAKYVCGHASTTDAESIEEIYRQFKRFDPQRFIRVADAMHDWYHSSQST